MEDILQSDIEQWGVTIDPKYEKKISSRNEHLRIVCKGLGLETHPRHPWDLFVNVSVLMYRMFQSDHGRTV